MSPTSQSELIGVAMKYNIRKLIVLQTKLL